MAELEINLPMYWNVQTHHFLYCRLHEQIKLWGRMKASNCLVFERTHICLRSMARSSKCMLESMKLNYVNYLAAQMHYRFGSTHFANDPRKSSLKSRVGVVEARGHCEPSATSSAPQAKFSDNLFSHIIDCWIANTEFEAERDKYVEAMEDKGITRIEAQIIMYQWTPPNTMPPKLRDMFNINRRAKVLLRSCCEPILIMVLTSVYNIYTGNPRSCFRFDRLQE
jgi:hypothetical protein